MDYLRVFYSTNADYIIGLIDLQGVNGFETKSGLLLDLILTNVV